MNVERDEGGSAFPELDRNWDNDLGRYVYGSIGGMTLRDYFAAKAMHQFMRGAVLPPGFDATEQLALVGQRAYEVADAMLKARSA
jgi:hypothetical protein